MKSSIRAAALCGLMGLLVMSQNSNATPSFGTSLDGNYEIEYTGTTRLEIGPNSLDGLLQGAEGGSACRFLKISTIGDGSQWTFAFYARDRCASVYRVDKVRNRATLTDTGLSFQIWSERSQGWATTTVNAKVTIRRENDHTLHLIASRHASQKSLGLLSADRSETIDLLLVSTGVKDLGNDDQNPRIRIQDVEGPHT